MKRVMTIPIKNPAPRTLSWKSQGEETTGVRHWKHTNGHGAYKLKHSVVWNLWKWYGRERGEVPPAKLEGQEQFSDNFFPCNAIGLMLTFAKLYGRLPLCPRCSRVTGRFTKYNFCYHWTSCRYCVTNLSDTPWIVGTGWWYLILRIMYGRV